MDKFHRLSTRRLNYEANKAAKVVIYLLSFTVRTLKILLL